MPMPHVSGVRTFVSGDEDGDRFRIRYYRNSKDHSLLAKVWFGPGTRGPPGCAHGGSMAALLDEAMGASAWIAGHPVVAVELTTRFKTFLPLGTPCLVVAGVDHIDGRKVLTKGVLMDRDGKVFAEGNAVFVELDPNRFGDMMQKANEDFKDALEQVRVRDND